MNQKRATKRLAELKKAIEAENISYSEIAELQTLSKYIDGDVVLMEWAGIPEHKAIEHNCTIGDSGAYVDESGNEYRDTNGLAVVDSKNDITNADNPLRKKAIEILEAIANKLEKPYIFDGVDLDIDGNIAPDSEPDGTWYEYEDLVTEILAK